MEIDASQIVISYRVKKGKPVPYEEQALLMSIMEEVIHCVNQTNEIAKDKQQDQPMQA